MGGLVGRMAAGLRAEARDVTDERWWGGDGGPALGRVTAETIVHASAVFPIVGGIAEILGSFTLEVTRRDGETGEHWLSDTLSNLPNGLMSGPEFWSTMAFNAVLRGRAYAEPVTHGVREVEIWPLSPLRLQEQHAERQFGVDYWYQDGRSRHFRQGELLSVTGLSSDGVFAVAPWKVARTAIELANLLEAFGERFFRNGARPSGILSTEQTLTPDAIKRLETQFNGNFAGVINAGKVPVLEGGLDFKTMSASTAGADHLDLRRHQIKEMARNWRYPLFLLGEGEGNAKDEQQAASFVKYCLRPWLNRIERSAERDLLSVDDRRVWKIRFNIDALLRGDSATQWRNAVLARTSSVMSVNDIRVRWFNLPRIADAWADDPREPLNSNRAADTADGGMTSPQDRSDA